MEPQIKTIEEKFLIGMSKEMSIIENHTFQLFSSFMPRKKEIQNLKSQDIYDLIIYPKGYFLTFDPTAYFKKHALVEIENFDNVPDGLESFTLPKGKYAVFISKGHVPNQEIFQYIYSTWLPNSDFQLDDRPHFDILSAKIQQKAPDAQQEIWIPVSLKK
ncbi:MAG: GyrI-like domain-containing protein [Saprospiraceae bacterium]